MNRRLRPARSTRVPAARRRRTIALGALALIMGAFWLTRLVFTSPTSTGGTGAVPAGGEQVASPRGGTVHVEWPARRNRNPFTFDRAAYVPIAKPEPEPEPEPRPAAPREEPVGPSDEEIAARELEKLSLQVTVEGGLSRAIINGRSLRPGDTVNGFTVVEIGTRSVTLRYRSVEVVLEM